MSIIDVIRARRSVRSFDKRQLSSEDAEKIMNFAKTADNPYGIVIEWYLLNADRDNVSSVVISNCDTYIAGKMKKLPHSEEAFGYSFEHIVLYAQSLGIGTTWIAGTMDRKAFENAVDLQNDEVMPCVSPLGYPASKMSFRETMMRKGVKADSRYDFEKLFFKDGWDKPLSRDEAGELGDVLEAVRLGPSAVNKQPWRIVICGNEAHFYKTGNSSDWDIQKVDLGIAMCHFVKVMQEKGIDVTFEINDPKLPDSEEVTYIASYKW